MDYEHSSHNGDLDHGAYLPNPFHKNSGLNNLIQILEKHSSCFWYPNAISLTVFECSVRGYQQYPSDYQSYSSYVVPLGSMVLDPGPTVQIHRGLSWPMWGISHGIH